VARKTLNLDTSRAEWTCLGQRPGSYPSRPLKAILAGGNAVYGNVKKLPDLLWRLYGIAVITHAASIGDVAGPYDLCIGLVDQTSHPLIAAARDASDANINCPSTWSKIQLALTDIGIEPFYSENFEAPIVETPTFPTTARRSNVVHRTKNMTSRPKSPAKQKKPALSETLQQLLAELKPQLVADDIEHMEIEVSSDGTMTVHSRRIVVVEDIASF